MGLMELSQPHTLTCGRHCLKFEEKRTDYLFIRYFHFFVMFTFFYKPISFKCHKAGFTDCFLEYAACQCLNNRAAVGLHKNISLLLIGIH